jgi:hypothetical protein
MGSRPVDSFGVTELICIGIFDGTGVWDDGCMADFAIGVCGV